MQTSTLDFGTNAFQGKIRTWDPLKAKEAYEHNDVVVSVESTLDGKTSKELDHEIASVVDQVSSEMSLQRGDWQVGDGGLDALDRLKNSLTRHAHGNKLDIQTLMYSEPVGEGRYTDRVAVVREYFDGARNLDKDLNDVEQSNLGKIASRSMARPWRDMSELRLGAFSDNSLPLQCNEVALKKAVRAVGALLPKSQLIPAKLEMAFDNKGLSPEDLVQYNLKEGYTPMVTTTSSGPPYFLPAWYPSQQLKETNAKLYKTVAKAFNAIMDRVKQLRRDFSSGEGTNHVFWGQLNFRTNDPKGEGDPDLKATRLVFGAEKAYAILAKTYTIPINNALKSIRWYNGVAPFAPMMGSKYTDAHVHAMLKVATDAGRTLVCGDMSHFDNSKVQSVSLMIGEQVASWFRHVDVRRAIYQQFVVEYTRACMAVPDQWISPRPIGQASGSGWTLLMNCLMLLTLMFYGHYAGFWEFKSCIVQGDDFVSDLVGATPEAVESAAKELGLEANASKQYFNFGRAEFLRCIHKAEYPGGIASIARTLGNMTAPEKRVTLKDRDERIAYETIRAISQLHNIEFSGNLVEVISFVEQYDPAHLLNKKSFDEIASASGDAGKELLAEESREGRKQVSSIPAGEWLANRVRMGLVDIPAPAQRYPYVYGESYETVMSSGKVISLKSENYLKEVAYAA